MTMRLPVAVSVLACVVILVCQVHAAPLRPLGPADITGTVVEATWTPAQKVKGIQQMPGAARIDRTVPAHFLIALEPFEGVDAKTAWQMSSYLDESLMRAGAPAEPLKRILLQVDHADKDFLKKGMKITVKGYKIAGDEGGTWTYFTEIKILQP